MRAAREVLETAGLLVAVAVVGVVDYRGGSRLDYSLLYLLPILAAGWRLSLPAVVVTSSAAGAVLFAANFSLAEPRSIVVDVWTGFSRLIIYLAVGLLTARVRRDRDRLRKLLDREALLARTDAITGLPNTRGFTERLLTETSRSRRAGRPLCLAYIDIDNFKSLNDHYGHATGDAILVRIAAAIRDTIRAGDVPARLGGDEFAILFWEVDRSAVEGIARRIMERIRDVGASYPAAALGASVGIAFFERPPDSSEDILKQADASMYEAKALGKGRMVVWSSTETGGAIPTTV